MLLCLSKFWIYMLVFTILLFLLTAHMMVNTVFKEQPLEPLFQIDSSDFSVDVRVNSNLTSSWITRRLKHPYNQNKIMESYYIRKNVTEHCPNIPPGLEGRISLVKKSTPTFQDLLNEFKSSMLQMDGRYQPPNCIPRFLVAIIVPYRDRFEHLNIFLRNIHPFVQKHQVDYTIFIVEQAGDNAFNRGMLMNVGFVEAMKIRPFDCFIFHDVDLLPEDDRNVYTCPDQPRHMSVAVDVFRYKLPYRDIFGGITAMSAEHFQLVNGYSNMFWGWGGEDDDMSMRIRMKGLHLARYPSSVARYTMLPHEKQKANPNRFEKLYLGRKRFKTEGLYSLEYRRISIQPRKLFTWILVKLTPPQQENIFVYIIKNSYFAQLLGNIMP